METTVTFKDEVKKWRKNPQALLSFLLENIWKAGIKPDEPFRFGVVDGQVLLGKAKKEKEDDSK